VAGAYFWDLFAGSGAYGLEALSRGAAGGVFVERDAKAVACVRQNLAAVGRSLGGQRADVEVSTADALTWAPAPAADLVFVDPPYEIIAQAAPVLFVRLTAALAAKREALVIFEMPGGTTLAPPGWSCVKRLGRGLRQPTVAIFRQQ
jgi:16S rRNA (guanine966-N2)-methyltransferase